MKIREDFSDYVRYGPPPFAIIDFNTNAIVATALDLDGFERSTRPARDDA